MDKKPYKVIKKKEIYPLHINSQKSHSNINREDATSVSMVQALPNYQRNNLIHQATSKGICLNSSLCKREQSIPDETANASLTCTSGDLIKNVCKCRKLYSTDSYNSDTSAGRINKGTSVGMFKFENMFSQQWM